MPLYVFVYACGASWCGPTFNCEKSCPAATEFRSIAFTPEGSEPAKCENPPAPPVFCDSGPRLLSAWKPTSDCPHPNTANQSWALLANHVNLDGQALTLTVDGNITGGQWYCVAHDGFSQGGAQVTGASYVHYGRITAVLRTGGHGITTLLQVGESNSTAGIGLMFDGTGQQATLQINRAPPQVISLPFAPEMADHNFSLVWSPDSVSLIVDGKALAQSDKSVSPPQQALPIAVSATPSTLSAVGMASITAMSFTPAGAAHAEPLCDAPPTK